MDDSEKKIITNEVNEIIESRYDFIDKHYLSIREIYKSHYSWPEFDPLRHEICICIMFGLCQSAITLTNHLLEGLLKYSLIIIHGKSVKQSKEQVKGKVITSLVDKYAKGIEKYGNINLSNSINIARKRGLISEEQKKELHAFREIFRNAYSHADINKTFGKSTMPVTAARIENDKIVTDESGDIEIAKLLIGQGLAQFEISQRNASPYFIYIDNLVRQIKDKIFSKDNEKIKG